MNGSQAVIDASIALRLFLPYALRGKARQIISELGSRGSRLVAPTLWVYETASGVCRAIHQKAISPDEARRILTHLENMPVLLVPPDERQNSLGLEWMLKLKRGAAYDSYYLALAETFACDLWAAGRHLYHTVDKSWMRWIEEAP